MKYIIKEKAGRLNMNMENDISLEIEYKANKKIARIMRDTVLFFILLYSLHVVGIFIIDKKVMTFTFL